MSGVRDKILPANRGAAIFNDRGNGGVDATAFVEGIYSRSWGRTDVEWRVSYDRYSYLGKTHYPLDGGGIEDNRESDRTSWAGSKLTLRLNAGRAGQITAGAETRIDLQTMQSNYDVQPEYVSYVNVNRRDIRVGVFLQEEIALSEHWQAVAGARLDTSDYRENSVSPRAGLIWSPVESTAVKFLYGTSFRNPNSSEMFFADGWTESGNPALRPERGQDYEVVVERQFGTGLKLSASGYRTDLKNLIVGVRDDCGLLQYQNVSSDRIFGGDAEISGRFRGIDLASSFAVQNGFDTGTRSILVNSPRPVAKVRFAVPLLRNHLTAAGAANWIGPRQTPHGDVVPWAAKTDVTLTTSNLGRGFDLQFGVRNLFDRKIWDPVALNDLVDVMPRPGRQVFLRLIWRSED